MDQLIERCCGLDVHRDTVAACVRVPGPNGKRQQEVRTFGATAGARAPLGCALLQPDLAAIHF